MATTRTSQKVMLCPQVPHNSSVTSNTPLCHITHQTHRVTLPIPLPASRTLPRSTRQRLGEERASQFVSSDAQRQNCNFFLVCLSFGYLVKRLCSRVVLSGRRGESAPGHKNSSMRDPRSGRNTQNKWPTVVRNAMHGSRNLERKRPLYAGQMIRKCAPRRARTTRRVLLKAVRATPPGEML